MVATAAFATAALSAAPIIGQPLSGSAHPVRLLDPTTLAPIPGGPRLPKDTVTVERSPDGRRLVALGDDVLVFYGASSGNVLGRLKVPRRTDIAGWLTPDRLLTTVSKKGTDNLQVIDPLQRKVIDTKPLTGSAIDSAVVGDRTILYNVDRTEDIGARVVDANGDTVSTIALPGAEQLINGPLVNGSTRDNGPLLYSIDVTTGTATRSTPPFPGSPEYMWAYQATVSHPAVVNAGRIVQLDPETLKIERTTKYLPRDGAIYTASDGYVVSGGRAVAMYETDGSVRWTRRERGFAGCCVVLGDRLYLQDKRRGRYVVRILSLRTGKLVSEVAGRFNLFEPRDGRSDEQVPVVYGDDLLPDDD